MQLVVLGQNYIPSEKTNRELSIQVPKLYESLSNSCISNMDATKNVKQILKQRCKADKIKRPTKPEEVAKVVYSLIRSSNLNFNNIAIDGGKIKRLKTHI